MSIGSVEQINTTPIAVADPVFSRTHQARAIVKRLSPRREIVCPLHNKAKEGFANERKKFIDVLIPFLSDLFMLYILHISILSEDLQNALNILSSSLR